jgi:hypothetical protein
MHDLFGGNRKEQLEELRRYHERLRSVVSDLLSQADEIDQHSRYAGTADSLWAKQLRDACNELVRLGDELPRIEQLLQEKKVKEGRDVILASCRKAEELAKRLRSIRR